MSESLPVSGPQNSMTSVAVLPACSLMNAFCISEVQHKAKRGFIGFHSEFAVHKQTHTDTKYRGLGKIYKHLFRITLSLFSFLVLFFRDGGEGINRSTLRYNAIQCNTTTKASIKQRFLTQ